MPEKKRNPQDTTLRNTRAAQKTLASLLSRVSALESRLRALEKRAAIVLLVAVLTSACGDLGGIAAPSTTHPMSKCQTAGSTVSILDAIPGC